MHVAELFLETAVKAVPDSPFLDFLVREMAKESHLIILGSLGHGCPDQLPVILNSSG